MYIPCTSLIVIYPGFHHYRYVDIFRSRNFSVWAKLSGLWERQDLKDKGPSNLLIVQILVILANVPNTIHPLNHCFHNTVSYVHGTLQLTCLLDKFHTFR